MDRYRFLASAAAALPVGERAGIKYAVRAGSVVVDRMNSGYDPCGTCINTDTGESTPVPRETAEKPTPFVERTLPWGETGREADRRLRSRDDREDWRKRVMYFANTEHMQFDDAGFAAMLEYPPDKYPTLEKISDEAADTKFLRVCREGLRIRGLPQRAAIEDEVSWIGANLRQRRPKLSDVPSLLAITWVMDLRTDPKMREAFWRVVLGKRLSPGERKPKSRPLREGEEEEGVETNVALCERLYGEDGAE